jgi:hypothetical protein
LEVVKNFPINAQGDKFFCAGEGWFFRNGFHRFGRCRLEHRFGGLPRVSRSSWSVAAHAAIHFFAS